MDDNEENKDRVEMQVGSKSRIVSVFHANPHQPINLWGAPPI